MNFETEAYIDEYVIDGRNTGVFAGDDTSITYTPEHSDMSSSVSIPTDEITSVTFRRNTSFLRNQFLGWFFAAVTLVLILIVSLFTVGAITGGSISQRMMLMILFMFLMVLGGISTTYEYFNGEEYDVIIASIRSDDGESQVFTGG